MSKYLRCTHETLSTTCEVCGTVVPPQGEFVMLNDDDDNPPYFCRKRCARLWSALQRFIADTPGDTDALGRAICDDIVARTTRES